jgi:hypothetical protein
MLMRSLRSVELPSVLVAAALLISSPSHALTSVYTATLTPVVGGTGSGTAQVDWDDVEQTMRVQAAFSGLSGLTGEAHIHAPTPTPGSGSAGIATQIPSFLNFPTGVQSGTYDMTFDMTLASSYNPQFILNEGGTVASAEAALKQYLDQTRAYFNIHSSTQPNGEIQGFLVLVPEPGTGALCVLGIAAMSLASHRQRRAQRAARDAGHR